MFWGGLTTQTSPWFGINSENFDVFVYLLQAPLGLCELLQLSAVPHAWELPPQGGGLRERYGETRGRRPAFNLPGLGERQALYAGDGEPVWGLGLGGRKGWQGSAGR